MLFGHAAGQHPLARWIDHNETYGRHIIADYVKRIPSVVNVLDLGAGGGSDLGIVKSAHPGCRTIAMEARKDYAQSLIGRVDEIIVADIERSEFPLAEESLDLVIANQVLEHTKEIFWIFDQVFRSLKVGGHFMIGVPNIASFHNRVLMLFGEQPTQHKLCSAHVRPFSKRDTLKFLEACFPGGTSLIAFSGAQFYPFPGMLSRPFARAFPTLAFSIFFLIRKTGLYEGSFASYPTRAALETNFWAGDTAHGLY